MKIMPGHYVECCVFRAGMLNWYSAVATLPERIIRGRWWRLSWHALSPPDTYNNNTVKTKSRRNFFREKITPKKKPPNKKSGRRTHSPTFNQPLRSAAAEKSFKILRPHDASTPNAQKWIHSSYLIVKLLGKIFNETVGLWANVNPFLAHICMYTHIFWDTIYPALP